MAQLSARLQSSDAARYAGITVAVIVGILLAGLLLAEITGEPRVNILQYTLSGLLTGGVYSLVALGIVLINKASGVFNFAHGFMMLFGGLMFWETFHAIPSVELSIIIGVTMGIIVMTLVNVDPGGAATKETRIQRFMRIAQTPRFLLTLAGAALSGLAVAFVLQELQNDLIRAGVGALVASVALGLAVERFTIRPLLGQPILSAIMMTLAIALVLQGVSALIWGTQAKSLNIFVEPARQTFTVVPIGVDPETGETITQRIPGETIPPRALPSYRIETEDLIGRDLTFQRNLVWGFGVAILCFVGFVLFFQFTGIGLAMRAVAEDQTLAESVGLRVRTILAVAWAIAATMAMIAAVIQGSGPAVGVSAIVIPPLAFRAFPAVLLGGLESITGALVGGLIIGVVEVMTTALVDSTTGQEFAPFAVLLIMLMIKPDGLFGQRRIDRV
ncbi:MAG: branched-chain amino acid ABC transporter permease [Anaerolineales bacterium]